MHPKALKKIRMLTKQLINSLVFTSPSTIEVSDHVSWAEAIEALVVMFHSKRIYLSKWQMDRVFREIFLDGVYHVNESRNARTRFENRILDVISSKDLTVIPVMELRDFIPEEDVLNSFIQLYENYPNVYDFYFPINAFDPNHQRLNISSDCQVRPGHEIHEHLKNARYLHLHDIENATFISGQRPYKKPVESETLSEDFFGSSFLKIRIAGLAYPPYKTEPEFSLIRSRLRQVIAVLHVLNYIQLKSDIRLDNKNIFMRYNSLGQSVIQSIAFYADEYEVLCALEFNDAFYESMEGEQDSSATIQAVKRLLDDASNNADRILNALDWCGYALIKSYKGSDQVFEYVAYMTALEALIGSEKPKASMTESLADKVSYLLGNTSEQRNQIRERFLYLYEVRSKLLHGRISFLDAEQSNALTSLRELTENALVKEIANYSMA